MNEKNELTPEEQQAEKFRKDRREFLGKSKYAAYMTPLMLSMVVDRDASAKSNICNNQGLPVGCIPP